ncbi:hypothetical protein SCYAM73S_07460 [Streptomyces cyaneofuscatus]
MHRSAYEQMELCIMWNFRCGLTKTRLPSISSVCGGRSSSVKKSSTV